MPLERAVVVRGSPSGSSAAKDRRTVEEPVRPVAKWVWIYPWAGGSARPYDATVYLSSDRSATGCRFGKSRLKLGEQLLECDLVRSHERIHVGSSFECVKQLRRGGMSWREMRAQHD